ncbi:MAG TPA: HD domain-containing protein [Chitinophagales bacterium]|nr:HD domain-containing protein [Chitinophagales bacterium]HNL85235.1 HD domain-containing protein [Chitinophagales bacterium]
MEPNRLQEIYQKTILFAGEKHSMAGQYLTGTTISYVVHLSNVAMEILIAHQHQPIPDINLAVQVALLHDVLEDTPTDMEELKSIFGDLVANAVLSLTKNKLLPENEQMPDSLNRIKQQGSTVASVKLADRITNLQPPPAQWNINKISAYCDEAVLILTKLVGANTYLENRLSYCIEQYARWIK